MLKDNTRGNKIIGIATMALGILIIGGVFAHIAYPGSTKTLAVLLLILGTVTLIFGVTMGIRRTKSLKRQKLSVASLLLCILIVSPPISGAVTNNIAKNIDSTEVIDVRVTDSWESIKVLNETLPVKKHILVETFVNGSRKVTISVNISQKHQGICITMETMIPTTYESIRTARTVGTEVNTQNTGYTVQSSVYPWKDWWDGMLFVLQGNNGTHLASYPHDDTFDTYFPNQPFLSWVLQGLEKEHQKIGADIAAEWLSGAKSREEAIFLLLTMAGGSMSVLGGFLALFENPLAGLLAIAAGVSTIIAALLQLLGWPSWADYLENVAIDKMFGEIFIWTWGWKLFNLGAYITNPPIMNIHSYNDLYILLQHHRIEILLWGTLEYLQSWGADRDCPQKYSIYAWNARYVNPGVIATTPDEYSGLFW